MDFREIIAFALSSRNEVSQPWFATRLVATISFELCTQFRALCSALCSAPCFALCALHACALRSATCSALCTMLQHDPYVSPTTTSVRLFSPRSWPGSSLVHLHPFWYIPVVIGRPAASLQVSNAIRHIWLHRLSFYLKQTQKHWWFLLLASTPY
jgi:hypothetical protein